MVGKRIEILARRLGDDLVEKKLEFDAGGWEKD